MIVSTAAARNRRAPRAEGVVLATRDLDGADIRASAVYPTGLDAPAGRHELLFCCFVLQDNLRVPRVPTLYGVAFIASHRYEMQPASKVPDRNTRVRAMGPAR